VIKYILVVAKKKTLEVDCISNERELQEIHKE